MPGVSVGGELSGHVRYRWLVGELVAMDWLRTRSVSQFDSVRVDVQLALAALRIGWGPEHLPLHAWVGGELGELRGSGAPFQMQTEGGRWVAVETGFAVAWRMFTHVRLVGAIEVAVPVSRPRFVLEGGSEIYRSAPVTVRSGFGVEVGWQ
jgi:hypothetical protein